MPMADDDGEDPFACFGDSDENEDADINGPSSWAARTLVQQANQRMQQKGEKESDGSSAADAVEESENNNNHEELQLIQDELVLWPESPPLYIGPIRLVSSLPLGGGRGYVAVRPLEPGTLILVEEPLVEWPDQQLGKALDLVSVHHILQHPSAITLIHDMEDFYPTKQQVDLNDDTDKEQIQNMMEALKEQEKEERIEQLVKLASERGLTSRNGMSLSETDMLRLLLALRYNGLETGVYRHVAMLNHCCSSFNCVKYQPSNGKTYSEVRTTRPVLAGESLTISYLPHNGLLSHATRRRLLWDQHRFDIGDKIVDEKQKKMELVGNVLPESSIHHLDKSAVTYRIESACRELEDLYHDAQAVVSHGPTTDNDDDDGTRQVWEQLRALEVSSLELYQEAKRQLCNDIHLLLIPCLRLHLNACELVQKDPRLTASQRIKLLCRMVASARTLVELQVARFGKDHYDIAQTNLELAQSVQELLSRAPKQLLRLRFNGMTSFQECSSVEYAARKEYERIQALYPHDVEEHIASATRELQS